MSEVEIKEKGVSIRAYARSKGCSDTTVHKAIKSKKIVNGVGENEKGDKVIYPSIADKEWKEKVNPLYQDNPPAMKASTLAAAPSLFDQPAPDKNIQAPTAKEPSQEEKALSISKIAKSTYDARIRELEWNKLSGALVDKNKVVNALFEAGKDIRTAILAVPDRVIDDIMASKSRGEAHGILLNALEEALKTIVSGSKKLEL